MKNKENNVKEEFNIGNNKAIEHVEVTEDNSQIEVDEDAQGAETEETENIQEVETEEENVQGAGHEETENVQGAGHEETENVQETGHEETENVQEAGHEEAENIQETEIEEDDVTQEEELEESDEVDDFDDEEEDIFEALLKNSEIKSDKTKKKKAGVKVYALVFFWILFIFLVVVFFFYFMKDLPFFNKDKVASNSDAEQLTYEVNAYPDINMLISEFLSNIVSGNEEGLRSLVLDPNGDMTQYMNRAFYISEFSNINCYTLPGYADNETLVYVTYNITIPEVESKPIDIQQFYVVSTEYGYKIDNTEHSVEVATYINEQNLTESVQALYESIKNSIDQSLQEDPTFASFYEEILNVQGN